MGDFLPNKKDASLSMSLDGFAAARARTWITRWKVVASVFASAVRSTGRNLEISSRSVMHGQRRFLADCVEKVHFGQKAPFCSIFLAIKNNDLQIAQLVNSA
jgi:hypothetical protein